MYSELALISHQRHDLAAISPTGTGKTLSYLIPIMAALGGPVASSSTNEGAGVRAVVLAPTRELSHQIYNECLKLAQGRKWRIVLFSKATASTLEDKAVRDKIGMFNSALLYSLLLTSSVDVIISTPLRLVASLQNGTVQLDKYASGYRRENGALICLY